MKKNSLFMLAAVAMLLSTSCKKNFTCECDVNTFDFNTGDPIMVKESKDIKDTKKNAEDECDDYEDQLAPLKALGLGSASCDLD